MDKLLKKPFDREWLLHSTLMDSEGNFFFCECRLDLETNFYAKNLKTKVRVFLLF